MGSTSAGGTALWLRLLQAIPARYGRYLSVGGNMVSLWFGGTDVLGFAFVFELADIWKELSVYACFIKLIAFRKKLMNISRVFYFVFFKKKKYRAKNKSENLFLWSLCSSNTSIFCLCIKDAYLCFCCCLYRHHKKCDCKGPPEVGQSILLFSALLRWRDVLFHYRAEEPWSIPLTPRLLQSG